MNESTGLNLQPTAGIGASGHATANASSFMEVVREVGIRSAATSGNATANVPALEQINAALKYCRANSHPTRLTATNGSVWVNLSHAGLRENSLVIPDMAAGDRALDLVEQAIRALVAEGHKVGWREGFRNVWIHIPGVKSERGKLVAL